MRRASETPVGLDSKNVLPVPVAEACLLFKIDQTDPISCFPDHTRKAQYFPLLRGFCFASNSAPRPQQSASSSASGSLSSANWEYHNFVVTIENGDRLYGHCLKFFDLQSHANASLARNSPSDSIAIAGRAVQPVLNCAMCVLSKFPFYDTYRKWLLHVCKEAYLPDVDSDSRHVSVRIEPRLINLVTEMVAIRSSRVATKLSLTINSQAAAATAATPPAKRTVDLAFKIAHRTRGFPPLDFNLRYLFSCFDTHNIVTLFEALVFGEQIVMLSHHLSLLAHSCETLTALLFPLTWPFSYVPVFSNDIPIDYVGGLTPFVFGIPKSHPGLEDTASLFRNNSRMIIADLDENKVHFQQRPQRLPAVLRHNLIERVQRVLHPELFTCDYADLEAPILDHQTITNSLREAFFKVFVELFDGIDFKNSSAFLEEQGDTQEKKDRKAFCAALASLSPAFQFFVDYVQPDNLLFHVLKLPRESIDSAIAMALKGPVNLLSFSEPEVQRIETKTRPDVSPWDTRLFYQPRFEFLSSHVDRIIGAQPELTDLYVLRIHYLLADKRAPQVVANLKELCRVDPKNPLLECRDIFNTLFSQLPSEQIEELSREMDRVGDWARFFYLHEKRRTSQELSPESLAVFKYVIENPDSSAQAFSDLIKKNLPALGCHKDNMTLLMLAASELKPKMCYVLLKFNAASDFEGSNGSTIHFITSPRFKARTEVQYLLMVRVLAMLIARGEEVDKRDLYQCSGLIKLCQRANPSVSMIRFLLQNGADPNVSDVDGLSAISSLMKSKQSQLDLGDAEAYSTLVEFGANVFTLKRSLQELDTVITTVGSAILRDASLSRLQALHPLLLTKKDAFARVYRNAQQQQQQQQQQQMQQQQQQQAASPTTTAATSALSLTTATSSANLQGKSTPIIPLIKVPSTNLSIPQSPQSVSSSSSLPSPPVSPSTTGGSGPAGQADSQFLIRKLHSDAYANATFEICEAQFQHLIRLHLVCHKYLDPLQRPETSSRHMAKKEKGVAERILTFAKPLHELLMTHSTLFTEIRKENAIYGSSSIARNVGTLFHPFMSTFNSCYPQFVSALYESITPEQLQRDIAGTDTLRKWLDSIAIKQSRVISDSFYMMSSNATSLMRLLEDIADFPGQMHILFEDLMSKTDRGSDDYNLSYPLCNQLENLRNKLWVMKQSTISRKIQGLDPDSGSRGVLLLHGVLWRVQLPDGPGEDATEIRKQDMSTRQTFLFSLDSQKGYLVFCEEQQPNQANLNTSLVLRESLYLNEVVPFDLPTFQFSDGKEGQLHCFQLIYVGHSSSSRHEAIIMAAATKEQKDKWMRMLWRLCMEGHAYSRNMGKYALYKRIGPSSTSYEGYLDYRTDSARVPWKCHYFVLSRNTLYAFQTPADRHEPIVIIRLSEYELLNEKVVAGSSSGTSTPVVFSPTQSVSSSSSSTSSQYTTLALRPHQFYQPKYLFRFGAIPRSMVKPDPSSNWRTVLMHLFEHQKIHTGAQASVSVAVGMAGLQPPPSPSLSASTNSAN